MGRPLFENRRVSVSLTGIDLELERGRALLRLGEVQADLGKSSAAAAAFQQAEDYFVELAGRLPALADVAHIEQGRARNRRGSLLADRDDPQALALWRSTTELLRGGISSARAASFLRSRSSRTAFANSPDTTAK